jgi:hypothetical protein
MAGANSMGDKGSPHLSPLPLRSALDVEVERIVVIQLHHLSGNPLFCIKEMR